MDWENERYVRVYSRDTADLLAVGWKGRAVLWELMRKADRAGIIEGDASTLAALLRMPSKVVSRGLAKLIERGCVEVGSAPTACFVLPNFLEAQEAKQSDRQRQRESRAKRRDHARTSASASATVTNRDQLSRDTVTNRDRLSRLPVHSEQNVTPSLAEPSLAEPSLAEEAHACDAPHPQQIEHDDPQVLELANAIAAQEMFAGIDALDVAGGAIHLVQGGRLRLPWLVAAVGDCAGSARAARAAGQPWSKTHSADRLMRYLRKARRQDIAPKVDVMTEMKNGSYGAERAVAGANQHSPGLAAWIAQQGSGAEQSPIDGGGDGVAAIAELARSFGGRKS